MTVYLYLKLLHVSVVTVWLGGGFTMIVLAMRAMRVANPGELVRVVCDVSFLMKRVFMPAALVAFATGTGMVIITQAVAEAWILIALGGFVMTVLISVAVVKPRAERIVAMVAEGGAGPKAAVARCRQLLRIAQFNYATLFIILADMVLKPTMNDTGVLVAMAAVVTASAFYFLVARGGLKPEAAAAGV